MSFEEEQERTARWMGYPNRHEMNADHDALHEALGKWLHVPSPALRQARGEKLDLLDEHLAQLEETAVLHLQRYMQHAGGAYDFDKALRRCSHNRLGDHD